MFGFGNSDDEFRRKRSRSVDEDYDEDFDDEDEEDEDEEDEEDKPVDETCIYGKEINPEHIQVVSKKYLDIDDDYDYGMRIAVIKDVQAGKEYIIFDSENGGLVVKER